MRRITSARCLRLRTSMANSITDTATSRSRFDESLHYGAADAVLLALRVRILAARGYLDDQQVAKRIHDAVVAET